jgi:hypothetical protein
VPHEVVPGEVVQVPLDSRLGGSVHVPESLKDCFGAVSIALGGRLGRRPERAVGTAVGGSGALAGTVSGCSVGVVSQVIGGGVVRLP